MSSLESVLGGLAKEQFGLIIGIGVGSALAAALEPQVVAITQAEFDSDPLITVDPQTSAMIVAEAVELMEWGKAESRKHGINETRFEAIVGEVLNAPGAGELLRMARRGTISADEFVHGLRKAKMEARWDEPMRELQTERLDPAVVATAIQRGIIEDPGLLPVDAPVAAGRVPPMPRADVPALKEAAASGIDRERLAALTRIVGLPPAPGELLQLLNRGEIDETDFFRGVSEGNTRNEWGPFLVKLRRRLVTPHEYQEAALRGVLTNAQADSGAALSGMEQADARLLFEIMGRPLAVHQITTGLARGGIYGGTYADVPEPYRDAIRRSSIRPEYAKLAYANRFTLPGAFVIRTLAQAGDLTLEETHQILLDIGWPPALAAAVSARWHGGAKGKADPHVAKAETHLWNALHSSYTKEESDEAQITPGLHMLNVADVPAVIRLWNAERTLIHAQLTPAQIKKAHKTLAAAWPRDRALQALEARGYTADEAATLLDE